MQKLILITGSSGSGKTTVLSALENYFPKNEASFNYFDDIGVPSLEEMIRTYGSPQKWQKEMTHAWIKKLGRIKDKKFIFLEGSFNPEFALSPGKNSPLIICLCANRVVREERLRKRGQVELITQDMENFAQFLKNKTVELEGYVIDTSDKSPPEVAQEISDKLMRKKGKEIL